MSIDDVRAGMREDVLTYLRNPGNDILFLKMTPGSGKSITTLKTLIEEAFDFIYLCQTHRAGKGNIREIYKMTGTSLLQLESRRLLCRNENYKRLERDFGISLKSLCLHTCEDRQICPYYEIMTKVMESPQSWSGVHHHVHYFVQSYLEKYEDLIDCVILDENFISSIFESFNITYGQMQRTLIVMNEMGESPEWRFIRRFISAIMQPIAGVSDRFMDFNTLKELIREYGNHNTFDFKDFNDEYNEILLRLFLEEKKKPFRNIVRPISELAKDTFIHDYGVNYLRSCISFREYKGQGYGEFSRFRTESINDINIPIIILDATTTPDIYRSLLRKDILLKEKDIAMPNAWVFQLTQGLYSMETLREGSRKYGFHWDMSQKAYDLMEIVGEILKFHKKDKVLIMSRMGKMLPKSRQEGMEYPNLFKAKIFERLTIMGFRNFKLEHYGGIRGTNDYIGDEYKAVILFGTPIPNPRANRKRAKLLRFVSIRRRPIDTIEEILRYNETEGEMIQSLHRIRPILKEKTYVYILTKQPLEEIEKIPGNRVIKGNLTKLKKIIRRKGDPNVSYSEETKDRVKMEVLKLLKESPKSIVNLRKIVKGYGRLKEMVFQELENEERIERFKGRSERGRKPYFFRIKKIKKVKKKRGKGKRVRRGRD